MGSAMTDPTDGLIKQMAEMAQSLDKTTRIAPIIQRNMTSPDDLLELYLSANFEQRHQMFLEIIGSQGTEGLEVLQGVYEKSFERINAGGGGEV